MNWLHYRDSNWQHRTRRGLLLPSSICVYVCLLVTRVGCAKTDEPIEMPFGIWTRGVHWSKEPFIRWGVWFPHETEHFRGTSPSPLSYRECPACGRYSQPYSVGGSSDAAFRCQYGDNLLYVMLLKCVVIVLLAETNEAQNTHQSWGSDFATEMVEKNFGKFLVLFHYTLKRWYNQCTWLCSVAGVRILVNVQ